ncbi:hypothetical protein [Francisella frigiditurris]|uniref:Uncharacterized protein n=1 Tax=Francisella frigiditurris TaxID=1542390 RepID=A0A1J0KRZ8_9GAMM|nr:hypothetical protein [Francisella frigiditurris]APC96479.1 hypothetical protein KX01_553 [Francisella frigiditurris]
MNCTSCNSENTQRLEVIYEDGTQHIHTKSKTAGTSLFNPIGGLFGAKTTTKGVSMSSAAKKAAPPIKKSFGWPIIMIIAGIICFNGTIGVILIGLLLIASGGFLGYKNFKYNSEIFPPLYSNWLNSWMCNKCGSIFTTE